MSLIRGWLFDNLGLKLVALLLAMLVYLNVYTDRPATLIVSFPLQIVDLPDSLSLSGAAPASVQAELRGAGKQILRMRLTEPQVKLSLAGVGVGRFERALSPGDLPLPPGGDVQVERLVSPRTVELQVDRRVHRLLPVAARVNGMPASSVVWAGSLRVTPPIVEVTGPAGPLAVLDSVRLDVVPITGKRDTVRMSVDADGLPDWSVMAPEKVTVTVPLEHEAIRRVTLHIEPPHGVESFSVEPGRVTLTISARRSLLKPGTLAGLRVRWIVPGLAGLSVGSRVGLRVVGDLPQGARLGLEPDSVTLRQARP